MSKHRRWLLVALAIALLPFAVHALHRLHRGRDLPSALRSLPTLLSGGASNGMNPYKLERAPYADAVYVGTIENRKLEEISGLVASPRRDDLLWGVNDGGSRASLFALGVDGRHLAEVKVYGARNLDWEDLSAFEQDGRSYLLAADIGDNFAWRRRVDLYVIEEPEVGPGRAAPEVVQVAWRIPFHYEDGPRDCEAFAFDPSTRQVLLVTKRDVPPVLYGFELGAPHDESERVARRLGELVLLPQPTREDREDDWLRGGTRSQPTALGIAPDGSAAVLLTYRDAYQFPRAQAETWAAAFARAPQRIPVPPMPQKEALAFARSGRSLYATSEQRPSPLFRFDPRSSSVECACGK